MSWWMCMACVIDSMEGPVINVAPPLFLSCSAASAAHKGAATKGHTHGKEWNLSVFHRAFSEPLGRTRLDVLGGIRVLRSFHLLGQMAEAVHVIDLTRVHVQLCQSHALLGWQKPNPVPQIDLPPPDEWPAMADDQQVRMVLCAWQCGWLYAGHINVMHLQPSSVSVVSPRSELGWVASSQEHCKPTSNLPPCTNLRQSHAAPWQIPRPAQKF